MTRTSNEIGDSLEARAASALGGERISGSGSGKFWKLDVRDKLRFIWSCKGTDRPYLRITKELILEARAAARGMRGTGDGFRGAIVAEVDGIAVVVVELDDFAELVTADVDMTNFLRPSKAQERRAAARRSPLG